jgi:outer membrane lipopolysaccharide assembly protein LptE/RlpB
MIPVFEMGRSSRITTSGLLLVWVLSVTGCGYQFTVEGPGPVIGPRPESYVIGPPVRLAIRTFQNRSFEPNLEFKYTRYVSQALRASGIAEVVEDEAGADFVLEGAILSVVLPTLSFSQTQTQESRVQVHVAVTVKDRTRGRVRWTHSGTSTAEFFVGATPTSDAGSGLQFNRVLQDRAVEQAGQMVAEDISDGFFAAREQGKFERQPKKKEVKKDSEIPEDEDRVQRAPASPRATPIPSLSPFGP